MDDTEMGRPARHDRQAKRGEMAPLGDVVRKGVKPSVRVRGTARCACGSSRKIDFSGPEDSMGATIARSQLAEPECDDCMERRLGEEVACERMEELAAQVRGRVERAGLPSGWQTLTFEQLEEKPEQARAVELARAWSAGGTGGLLLHGEVGVGKTMIAAAAGAARCVAGPVRWLSVAKLLMALRMPFDSPEYTRAVRSLEPGGRHAALVLDDLDKTKPSDYALSPLYVAINGWVETRQPLLVTCNRDLDALAEWMGETFGGPIASRLAGYCDVVRVGGEDLRLT